MAVGLVLRMLRIGTQPLWSDETATLIIAKFPALVLMTEAVDPTPGLYYLLHKLFIADSASLLEIRSISLIAGVMLIPLAGWFASLIGGRKVGLVTAALTALSSLLIDYSQEARTYSLLTLLILVSATGLLLILRRVEKGETPAFGSMAMFALGAVAASYAHYCSVFWIGPALLLLVVAAWRQRVMRVRLNVVVMLFGMEIAAMPGVVRLIRSMRGEVNFAWLPHANPAQFLATIGEQFLPTGRWTPNYLKQADIVGVLAGILLLQIVAIVLWRRAKQPGQAYPTALLAIFALAPVAMWLSGFVITPTFMPRTILWTVPGVLTIISVGAVELGGIPAAFATMAAYAVSLAFSGTMCAERQDTRPIIAFIRANARTGDVMLTCQPWRATELVAAAEKPLPMPLLSWVDRKMAMLQPELGGDARWAAHLGYTYGRPLARIEHRPVLASGRAWLVASQCSDRHWARLNGWLGRGRWVQIRKDSADALLPNDLWLFVPAEAPRLRDTIYRSSD